MSEYEEKFTAWPLLIGGIALTVIGLVCLLAPGLAYATMGLLIGVAFIFGAAAFLVSLVMVRNVPSNSYLTLIIVFGLVIGILFCAFPVSSTHLLVWLVCAALALFGIANLILESRDGNGLSARRTVESVVSIALAVLVMIFPNLLVYALALAVLAEGVMMIVTALQAPRELVN